MEIKMNCSLLGFITCVVITVLMVTIAWDTSAYNISMDCEKLGSFYQGEKIYECEVVK
jgi:hypothetical protein